MDSPPLALTLPSQGTPPDGSARVIAGKYRVGELLGRGGRGAVFRALQLDLDREVALKILAHGEGEDARARFDHEARIAADLRHPCIAEVFDAGVSQDGTPYYVMELLEGETLAARIARGLLAPEEAVTIAAGVCSALTAVHHKGVIHRDIKPSNIFLAKRPDGGTDPKIIDFGIAKRVAVEADAVKKLTMRGLGRRTPVKTVAGVIVGTPCYLSPEQVTGEPIDGRADVYALAATLYEALAGSPPFHGDDIPDLLAKILVDEPESIAARAPEAGVPAALDRAVMRGLAKEPKDRYATAADFTDALWSALVEGRRADPAAAPVASRGSSTKIAVAAAIAVALLAIAGVALRRGPERPPPPPAPSEPVTAAETAPPPPSAAPEPTSGPEIASPPATPEPAPRARGARPATSADRAPLAARATASAAPPESMKIDDLKAPF